MEAGKRLIRVLVVDDVHRLARAWERLLSAQDDMLSVGALSSADTLVSRAAEENADVVLLDLTMPGRDPLDAVRELASARPGTRTLVYSGYSDGETVRRALEAGAWGFIDKLAEPDEVLGWIRAAFAGERVGQRGFEL